MIGRWAETRDLSTHASTRVAAARESAQRAIRSRSSRTVDDQALIELFSEERNNRSVPLHRTAEMQTCGEYDRPLRCYIQREPERSCDHGRSDIVTTE